MRCRYNAVQILIIHGGPSEAGHCSRPPSKMAAAENPTRGEAAFDYVARHGELRFLAYKYVLDRGNLWYRQYKQRAKTNRILKSYYTFRQDFFVPFFSSSAALVIIWQLIQSRCISCLKSYNNRLYEKSHILLLLLWGSCSHPWRGCNCKLPEIARLGLKLINVSKRGHWI